MILYMLISCFLYYISNVPNNPYMSYSIYRQHLEKEGALDVDRRLASEFPKWFKPHVSD